MSLSTFRALPCCAMLLQDMFAVCASDQKLISSVPATAPARDSHQCFQLVDIRSRRIQLRHSRLHRRISTSALFGVSDTGCSWDADTDFTPAGSTHLQALQRNNLAADSTLSSAPFHRKRSHKHVIGRMTTGVMKLSYRQLKFAPLTGWHGGQDCLITFTLILGFREGLCQCRLLQSVKNTISPSSGFVAPLDDKVSLGKCLRVFLSV